MESNKAKKKSEKSEPDEPTVAGYKPQDLLMAPIEPPEPEDTRPPNIHQQWTMGIGMIIIISSVFFWAAFGLALAAGVAIAGGLVIASAVFLRI
jgi:hypothetical protein